MGGQASRLLDAMGVAALPVLCSAGGVAMSVVPTMGGSCCNSLVGVR